MLEQLGLTDQHARDDLIELRQLIRSLARCQAQRVEDRGGMAGARSCWRCC